MNRPASLLLSAALAITCFAGSPLASAQDAGTERGHGARCEGHRGRHGHGRHHDPEVRLARMRERLSLDDNQVQLIREAFADARRQHEALRSQSATAPHSPERRAQHGAIARSTMERIDAVLTPAQRTQIEQMRARRGERREHRHSHDDARGI